MNESAFTRKIHKMLPSIYCWKISDRYTAGIPDAYYSGALRDLWVEYKFEKKPRMKSGMILPPKLTELQKKWLSARHEELRAVCVVQGFADGTALIIPAPRWTELQNPSNLVPHSAVAEFIRCHCEGS
jgi:hypothetical protein